MSKYSSSSNGYRSVYKSSTLSRDVPLTRDESKIKDLETSLSKLKAENQLATGRVKDKEEDNERLKDELKKASRENSKLTQKVESLQVKLDDLDVEFSLLQKESDTKIRDLESAYDKKLKQQRLDSKQHAKKRESVAEDRFESQIGDQKNVSQHDSVVLRTHINSLQEALAAEKKENHALRIENDTLDKELRALGVNLHRAQLKLTSSDSDNVKEKTQIKTLERRVDRLRDTVYSKDDDLGKISLSKAQLREKVQELYVQIEVLMKDKARLNADHSDLDRKTKRRIDELGDKLAVKTNDRLDKDSAEAEVGRLEVRIDDKEVDVKKLQKQVEYLREELKDTESKFEKTAEKLQAIVQQEGRSASEHEVKARQSQKQAEELQRKLTLEKKHRQDQDALIDKLKKQNNTLSKEMDSLLLDVAKLEKSVRTLERDRKLN